MIGSAQEGLKEYHGWHRPWAPQMAALKQGLFPAAAALGPGLYTALGDARLCDSVLRTLTPAFVDGLSALWIDAGRSFDGDLLAQAAGTSRAAKSALSRIRLSIPGDAHALESALCVHLPEVWRGEPIVLADPLLPLSDTRLSEIDARRVFSRMLDAVASIAATWIVLAIPRKGLPERLRMIERLTAVSRQVVLLESGRLVPAPKRPS